METWLTYRPRDFLLYSSETYWRLFELANTALWPLPILSVPAIVILLVLARHPYRLSRVGFAALLAVSWIVVSEAFLAERYALINWAVAYIRPLFLVEAALLAALAWTATPVAGGRFWLGGVIVVMASAYPFLAIVGSRPLAQAEVFGIAPDPTAIGTLGLLLMAERTWRVGLLAVIPLMWLAASALTLHTIGSAQWIVPAVALAAAGFTLAALPGRSAA